MKEVARWRTYQRERFPLFAHGPLILAFSMCAVCYSTLVRGSETFPPARILSVAFISSLISFLHLRIADEFKDFEEDSRYRPYRPVPRGLVTLRELGFVWVCTGALQLVMALLLKPALLFPLLATWIYLGLMSREFFCRSWLKAHPFTYMWTHMLIMPLVDFYATACDWIVFESKPPKGLLWFVAVSFFNGFVLEIGRKVRAPGEEETGVETYSMLWGRRNAVAMWWAAIALALASALIAASRVGFLAPASLTLGSLLLIAILLGARFLRRPTTGKTLEVFSGAWTLVLYLCLGVLPMLWRFWS